MKTKKNILLGCMALLATFAFAVGCKTGSDSSSSTDSSSSSADSSNPFPDTYPENGGCEFGDWELFRAADCETTGVKVRRCILHEGHEDYELFPARQHDYSTQGICKTCQADAPLPGFAANPTYIDPATDDSIEGSGHEFIQYEQIGPDEVEPIDGTGKYRLSVGEYYQITIEQSRECWFEFGISEPGQYAVISTENPDNVKLQQYSPETSILQGPSKYMDDGNFLSMVNCDEQHFNGAWTAAFRVSGVEGDVVKFHIAKIAPPVWAPSSVVVDKAATQLLGKAPEGAKGAVATDVPYDSEYFYDAENGYYRMGTAENPGDIIYVAIDKNTPRLMGSNSFVGLQEYADDEQTIPVGGLRTMQIGTTIEGNYILGNYAPMLYNNPDFGGTENSYQAFMNSDGMYPVTEELHEFLTIYTARNALAVPPEEGYEENAWLSACFYYTVLTQGSEGNPYEITQTGTHTATQYDAFEEVYYKFTYTGGANTCKITVHTLGVNFFIGGDDGHSSDDGAVHFEVANGESVTLSFLNRGLEIIDISFTIEEIPVNE